MGVGGGGGGDVCTDLALVGRDWGRQGLLKALPGLPGGESALLRGEALPIISATSLNSAASARSRERLLDSLLICTFCSFCGSPPSCSDSVEISQHTHSGKTMQKEMDAWLNIAEWQQDNQVNVVKSCDGWKLDNSHHRYSLETQMAI